MKCTLCLPCFLGMKKAGAHDIRCIAKGVNMKITCRKCQRRRYGAEYEVLPSKSPKA